MGRPLYLALATVVVAFATIFTTSLGGPFTPVNVAQDLLCDNVLAENQGFKWDAAAEPYSNPCTADARMRLMRLMSIATYGSTKGYMRVALALIAAGNLGAVVYPRLVWFWAVGLIMLYMAAWGTTFQTGFWLSTGVVILTLFYET